MRKGLKVLLIIEAIVFIMCIFIDFCNFPEAYLTTWRYQLHRKVEQGDVEAVKYYQEVYLNNNRTLWE